MISSFSVGEVVFQRGSPHQLMNIAWIDDANAKCVWRNELNIPFEDIFPVFSLERNPMKPEEREKLIQYHCHRMGQDLMKNVLKQCERDPNYRDKLLSEIPAPDHWWPGACRLIDKERFLAREPEFRY